MKKTYLASALLVLLCSCQITKEQKAKKLVDDYLKGTLNDPGSYESVSFGNLRPMKDTIVMLSNKPDTIHYNGRCQIEHTYRAKNEYGGIVTKTDWFQVDSAMTKALCCFVGRK